MNRVRPLALNNREDLIAELRRVGVDEAGIEILAEKAHLSALKLLGLSPAQCNILKQSALAHGAECAVPRKVIQTARGRFDCILFGTQGELKRVVESLLRQPLGLAELGKEILAHLTPNQPVFKLKGYGDPLNGRVGLVGIVELAPGSPFDRDRLMSRAEALCAQGADILDLRVESTRPGVRPLPWREELARLREVIKPIRARVKVPISVETCKARVAEGVLELGADIITDSSGLRFDPRMAGVVARFDAGLVVVHTRGGPRGVRRNPRYKDLMGEVYGWLSEGLDRARDAGLPQERIVVDPGIGFGKSAQDDYQILRRLSELKDLGRPVQVTPSRKPFIGAVLKVPPEKQLEGSLSAAVLAVVNGARLLRVHDVEATHRAVRVAEAILKG